MTEETLLEKAQKIKVGAGSNLFMTDENIELAIAWLKNEITPVQINVVLGKPRNYSTLVFLARCLRKAYKRGKIKIVK